MAKRMTNAQLVDENIRLRAQCDMLERKLHEAEEQLVQRPVFNDGYRVPAAKFADYWDYVREEKRVQRGARVVRYMSREQWAQARA